MCGYVPGVNGPDSEESEHGVGGDAATGETAAALAAPPEVTTEAPSERTFEAPETRGHTLLAIDTSLGTAVALCHDGQISECSSDDTRGHTEVIGQLIARVFELADVSPAEVGGVVVGVGPGPFTGLRVGIAAAHAFAAGRGAPIHPLISHDAIALAVLARGATARVRVVQDAKRRELFVSEYAGLDWMGMPLRSADPHLVPRGELHPDAADCWPDRVPAARLLQLAARRLTAKQAFEPDRALYLRQPDVYPPAAPKRVSA